MRKKEVQILCTSLCFLFFYKFCIFLRSLFCGFDCSNPPVKFCFQNPKPILIHRLFFTVGRQGPPPCSTLEEEFDFEKFVARILELVSPKRNFIGGRCLLKLGIMKTNWM